MAKQTVFSRAVGYHLSSAIPVQLDRADEFAVGKVLLYHKKPRTLLPWRKHELNFTGYSLSDLLAEGSTLKFATTSNFFFDAGQGTETIDTKLGLDAELRDALIKLHPQTQDKHEIQTTIMTEFGKITQTVADCSPFLSDKTYSLNTSHPVVKEAIEKGATLFIISTLYEAEQCKLSIKVTENGSETVQNNGALPHGNGTELKDATYFDSTVQVADRNMRTPLGFLLLRLTIDSQGELRPELRLNYSTTTNSEWALGSLVANSFLPTALTGIHIQVDPTGSTSSLDSIGSREMVLVDSTKEDPKTDEPAQAKAPKDTTEQAENTHVHVPSVEVTSAMGVKEEVDFEPPPPANTMGDHYTHGLKDLQAFTGWTYEDILTEVKKWLEPLLAKPDLQKAFLEFINHCKPPNTYENLQKLSKYLKQVGDALRTGHNPSRNKDTELTPMLQELSSDRETELDQITAIILAAEACSEFPQHTLHKMFALDQEKRTTVLNLVKTTPYGTNRHVFIDEGPFRDTDLYPVLTKMGYSCPQQHLMYEADDIESDMPAAASTVIMIAPPLPPST